jgi:hypothetical protein
MKEYHNLILNKFKDYIKPVFNNFVPDYANFLIEKGVAANINLSLVKTFIDWEKYPGHYSFYYYFEGCENAISQRLTNTDLSNYDFILMDFGNEQPVFEIPMGIFIKNWLDFVAGAQYLTTVVTKDGKLILEFVNGDYLNSNFQI